MDRNREIYSWTTWTKVMEAFFKDLLTKSHGILAKDSLTNNRGFLKNIFLAISGQNHLCFQCFLDLQIKNIGSFKGNCLRDLLTKFCGSFESIFMGT